MRIFPFYISLRERPDTPRWWPMILSIPWGTSSPPNTGNVSRKAGCTLPWPRRAGQKPFEVDVDTDEPGATLKMQIYSITGVDADRQKILVKGGALKDDQDMAKLGLRPKQTLMLMGSASELPKAPIEKTLFVEDMDESQLAQISHSPPGLQNLGNTVSPAEVHKKT